MKALIRFKGRGKGAFVVVSSGTVIGNATASFMTKTISGILVGRVPLALIERTRLCNVTSPIVSASSARDRTRNLELGRRTSYRPRPVWACCNRKKKEKEAFVDINIFTLKKKRKKRR